MVGAVAQAPHAGNTLRDCIERLFDAHEWDRARWLLDGELLATPDDHWVHTQIALSWYEDGRHAEAQQAIERALALAPECPSVRWYHGGILHARGQLDEAITVYRAMVEREPLWASRGACGLPVSIARGLVADAWWRLSDVYAARGDRDLAERAFTEYLERLGTGCLGLYTLDVLDKYGAAHMRRQLRMRRSVHKPALAFVN